MNRACWLAAPDGRYWLDIALGGSPARFMLDTGIVDRFNQVGFDVAPALFDALQHSGHLVAAGDRKRFDANGQVVVSRVGFVSAQLLDPATGHGIGPAVPISIFRGVPGVPSRVGVEFFHRLTGCRVVWELDARTWCVEYP
jgi:hypothetical protein